ncbi:MAG: Tn3 family transposase [Verrucomicrobia bacterium]|nr:Tn3 family transposase [Verrucomicrobiota bacterium]
MIPNSSRSCAIKIASRCLDPPWHVTASLIIRKLASYPRQNSLHAALREVGRIERTLFMLEWTQDPELRKRVQVGLNKGEARNALARAVFFNRQGELRDRTFENQTEKFFARVDVTEEFPFLHTKLSPYYDR